jgi:hypothetical protein
MPLGDSIQHEYDRWLAAMTVATAACERDHGSTWCQEQFSEGARAAIAYIRAAVAAMAP